MVSLGGDVFRLLGGWLLPRWLKVEKLLWRALTEGALGTTGG